MSRRIPKTTKNVTTSTNQSAEPSKKEFVPNRGKCTPPKEEVIIRRKYCAKEHPCCSKMTGQPLPLIKKKENLPKILGPPGPLPSDFYVCTNDFPCNMPSEDYKEEQHGKRKRKICRHKVKKYRQPRLVSDCNKGRK